MRFLLPAMFGLIVLGGCSQYGYRYAPRAQPLGNLVFADYRQKNDRVNILIDTNGLRLESVSIKKPDGTTVPPLAVDYPAFQPQLIRGVREELYGPELAQGPTIAQFDSAAIGAAPWKVRIEIRGESPVSIQVGGQPTAIGSPVTLQASAQ